jgi:hypothetical protein
MAMDHATEKLADAEAGLARRQFCILLAQILGSLGNCQKAYQNSQSAVFCNGVHVCKLDVGNKVKGGRFRCMMRNRYQKLAPKYPGRSMSSKNGKNSPRFFKSNPPQKKGNEEQAEELQPMWSATKHPTGTVTCSFTRSQQSSQRVSAFLHLSARR